MIIFLDIDGVLVPVKSWESPKLLDDGFPEFSLDAIRVLRPIIFNHTKVMLTTSHKSRYTLIEWKKIFSKRGLKIKHIEKLNNNTKIQSRADEIIDWFKVNTVDDDEFMIIDDDKSLNALPENLKKHLILTSPMIGLNDRHSEEISNLLSANK